MRRSILALGLLGIALATPDGLAADLSETIRRIKPGIVGVGSFDPLRTPKAVLTGTGFLVANGRSAITNHHVVEPLLAPKKRAKLSVFLGSGEKVERRLAWVLASDPAHDVVLLAFEGAAGKPLDLDPREGAIEGESVAFTGYPLGSVYGFHPVTHRGIISAVTPVAIPQASARVLDPRLIRRLRDGFSVYQLDATAYPGNSGSPVYRPETGRVLGIVGSVFVKQTKEKVIQDPSGITFAIPIRHVRELLQAPIPGSEPEGP